MTPAVFGWSLAVAASLAATAVQLLITRRHWSGEHRRADADAWYYLPYSDEFKAGLKRTVPIITLAGLWFVPGTLSGLFQAIGGGAARWATPTALVAAGILALFFVLVHQVVYYNRPRFLVAPHYRDELGLAVIRRRAGTLRRSRLRLLLELAGWATAVVIVILLFRRD